MRKSRSLSPEGVYIISVNPRRSLAFTLLLASAVLVSGIGATSQTPSLPTLRSEDSGRWEALVPSTDHLGLSPDGSVLAYRIDRSNWEDELRVARLSDGRTLVVPYGRNPEYSADGRWLRYDIGHSPAEETQLKNDHRPVREGLGLVELSTFAETRFSDVGDSDFSSDGAYIAIERYVPRPADSRGGGDRRANSDESPRLYVRSLRSGPGNGTELAFDNVRQFEWQPDHGHLLAMNMGGDAQGGARVQLLNPSAAPASATTVLDDTPASFSELAWRANGSDLAYLRSHSNRAHAGVAFDVIAVRGIGTAAPTTRVYDATRDPGFPADTRVVDFRRPSWSADGRVIFVGIAAPQPAASDRGTGANVRIWHWRDIEVMPYQAEHIEADGRRNRLAAVNIDDGTLIVLAPSFDARAHPIPGTSLAWVADWSAYAMDRTLGRPAADLSLVDTRTGQRTLFATKVDDSEVHVRPDGGALVFLRDAHLWSLNTRTRALTDLSAASGASLIDTGSDTTGPHKPTFGIGGWTRGGAVLAYDRDDIWRLAIDGSASENLTDGAATRTRYRVAQLADPVDDRVVDDTRPSTSNCSANAPRSTATRD